MIEIILILLLFILFTFGIIEFRGHEANLSKIPIRIHVNGSRGKSSVTRLIAAGLRSGGFKTVAKTTGSSPRVIDENGKDLIKDLNLGQRFFTSRKDLEVAFKYSAEYSAKGVVNT